MKALTVIALSVLIAAGVARPPLPRGPSPPAAQRGSARDLVWGSFVRTGEDAGRRRLTDGDLIRVSVTHALNLPAAQKLVRWAGREGGEDIPRDRVEIVLVSGPRVTWWKGITAFREEPRTPLGRPEENWVRLARVDTQGDDRGPARMLLAAADLRGGLKLSFEKSNAFGSRAPVYSFDVPNVGRVGGHRITFTWEED